MANVQHKDGYCTRTVCICPTLKERLADIATILQIGMDGHLSSIDLALEKLVDLAEKGPVCDRKL